MAMTKDKAYSNGSEFPHLQDKKLRLYSMRLCPYAQRTRILLAHKKIPYETININLSDKPDWFLQRNPQGLVPVLEHDGKIVYESVICNEYLDDIYPEDTVTPKDPYRRARDKILLEMNSKFTAAYYKLLRNLRGDGEKEALEAVHKSLEPFEKAISERGQFYGGEKQSMLDFLLWPWYERIGPVKNGMNVDMMPNDKFPNLHAWVARMREVPEVKETVFNDDIHMNFYKSYMSGKPNYDIGLSS